MARRENSIFEDIADITSKFPWWVGVIFGLGLLLVFTLVCRKRLSAGYGIRSRWDL